MSRELFTLNAELDRDGLAEAFARDGRVQVRDFLTSETAEEIHRILAEATPWGIAWQAGDKEKPQAIEAAELRNNPGAKQRDILQATYGAAAAGDYAFQF